MIVSVSRRTDIPACYSDWFWNRLKEGYVLVRNPMNDWQVSRISLNPRAVDGFVFWTKNPLPMLRRLEELEEYPYYFQFTLTPYGRDLEPGLPSKRERLLPAFIALSEKIGPDRVVWRYDPIVFNRKYTLQTHIRCFEAMTKLLGNYTKRCVISFLDRYRKIEGWMKETGAKTPTREEIEALGKAFSASAKKYGIELYTCCETVDLSEFEIFHGSCVDVSLLRGCGGGSWKAEKDPGQRKECGCAASIDIGAYDTCRNLCRYCYANRSLSVVDRNHRLHNPLSPLLYGELQAEDRVTERKMRLLRDGQLSLFNGYYE